MCRCGPQELCWHQKQCSFTTSGLSPARKPRKLSVPAVATQRRPSCKSSRSLKVQLAEAEERRRSRSCSRRSRSGSRLPGDTSPQDHHIIVVPPETEDTQVALETEHPEGIAESLKLKAAEELKENEGPTPKASPRKRASNK